MRSFLTFLLGGMWSNYMNLFRFNVFDPSSPRRVTIVILFLPKILFSGNVIQYYRAWFVRRIALYPNNFHNFRSLLFLTFG
jgi:hypothetical protein